MCSCEAAAFPGIRISIAMERNRGSYTDIQLKTSIVRIEVLIEYHNDTRFVKGPFYEKARISQQWKQSHNLLRRKRFIRLCLLSADQQRREKPSRAHSVYLDP